MDAATTIREARARAGLSQRELARRAGTSQATISAYEAGRKEPSFGTLVRLVEAAGSRLALDPGSTRLDPGDDAQVGRVLEDVVSLAEALPAKHEAQLTYPRIPTR
jgi:transcriptional regulator with XRE-family HTH domain